MTHDTIADVIAALLALPPGWNSYGARTIDPMAAGLALEVLALHSRAQAYGQIVPTQCGGVQVEWHRCGWDIEVACWPDGRVSVYAHDDTPRTDPIEWEQIGLAEPERLTALLERVAGNA